MSETVRAKKELREAKKLTGQGQVIGDEGLDFFWRREGERTGKEGMREWERERGK